MADVADRARLFLAFRHRSSYNQVLLVAVHFKLGVRRMSPRTFPAPLSVFTAVVLLLSCQLTIWAFPTPLATLPLDRTTADLSQGRYDLVATSVGDKALFAGGTEQGPGPYTHVDIYNASTGLWSIDHLSVGRASLAATSVSEIAIFAGGAPSYSTTTGLAAVDIFDNTSSTWSTSLLSAPRQQLAATSHGTKAYISGGSSGGVRSDVIDIYDTITKQWSAMTMPTPRADHSSVTVGNKIIFAGGEADGSGTVDIYDVTTDSWTTGQLSSARHGMAATAVGNKAIFVGGSQSGQYQEAIDIYDAVSDTWTSSVLPHPTGLMAATTVGNYALFGGGVYTQQYDDIYIYDSLADVWLTAAPGLEQGRFDLAATSVGDLALFGGGYGFDAVDIFRVPMPVPEPTSFVLALVTLCLAMNGRRISIR